MTVTPGAVIALASLPNLRDLGGWRAADGHRVRHGQVYRSTDLSHLDDADTAALVTLGIRRVVDFRTDGERSAQPDRIPSGVEQVILDILRDATDIAPAQLLQLVEDPPAATAAFGGGQATRMFEAAYRDLVSLPSALEGYRRFFLDLAEDSGRPVLFHCTTGKDRTGWAAATTLMLLGVSEDDVRVDYLLTNDQLLPALRPILDGFAVRGGDPNLLIPVLGVRPEYLAAALDEMRTRYGTIEHYLQDGLGVDPVVQAHLRAVLLEPEPTA